MNLNITIYKRQKFQKILSLFIHLFIILQILLNFYLIKDNNSLETDYELIKLCNGEVLNFPENTFDTVVKRARDVYIYPELKNFNCLGDYVEGYIVGKQLNLFIGTNPKIINFIIFANIVSLFFYFLLVKKIKNIAFLYIILFFILTYYLDPKFSIFLKLFFIFENIYPYLITGIILHLIKSKENLNLKYDYIFQKLHKRLTNFLNSNSNIVVVIHVLWVLLFSKKYKQYLTSEFDFKITQITLERHNLLDSNLLESAWNQHTQFYFHFINLFSKFKNINFENGVLIAFLFSVILIYFLLIKIFNILKINNEFTILISFLISFRLLLFTTGDRVLFNVRSLGMVISLISLYFLFKYLEKQNNFNLLLFLFFTSLLVYNLESYAFFAVSQFIYLLYNQKEKLIFLSKSVFFLSISLTIIIWPLIFNNNFIELYQMKYLLHLKHTNIGVFNGKNIINTLGEGSFPAIYGGYKLFHLIIGFSIYIVFKRLKHFKTNSIYENILILFFISELFHLFFTGPRWPEYILVLKLPAYLLVINYLFVDKNLSNFRKNIFYIFVIPFITFPSILFVSNFNNSENYLNQQNTTSHEQIEILEFLHENQNEQLILTWINPSDWEWLYFRGGFLPSTRFWWWFDLRYAENYQKDLHNWNSWDDSLSNKLFLKDLNNENPKFAIINKSYSGLPQLISMYISSEMFKILETENYLIYKLKD